MQCMHFKEALYSVKNSCFILIYPQKMPSPIFSDIVAPPPPRKPSFRENFPLCNSIWKCLLLQYLCVANPLSYYPVIHIVNFKFSRRISTPKFICNALQITVNAFLYKVLTIDKIIANICTVITRLFLQTMFIFVAFSFILWFYCSFNFGFIYCYV